MMHARQSGLMRRLLVVLARLAFTPGIDPIEHLSGALVRQAEPADNRTSDRSVA